MMAIQEREQKEYKLFDLAQTNYTNDSPCGRKAVVSSVTVRIKHVIVTVSTKAA